MTSIARYTIMVVGVIVAFGAIGIGWSKVQWLVAAMTVGLGFGLQEIFANFVSGLILLFERPIRVGDTVTVGGVSGDVTRIRIRATTITDWDRKELVIPNKEFVTGQVINWSLSDTTLRIILPVGIAYGSNVELAEELLYKVAREHKRVLTEPEPRVLFMGFGDSSLNFELRVFIPSIDYFLQARHELNKAIDRAFREADVEIAFPQRDIHVRSIRDALPLIGNAENEPGSAGAGRRSDKRGNSE
jgi:potassium efflux system protein